MKILGLDVSTKTGYAIIQDGVLLSKGLIKEPHVTSSISEDVSILYRAINSAKRVCELILKEAPDTIVIEQTNAGRFRSSQKQLEFIHCLVLYTMEQEKYLERIVYVDTSQWRSALGIKLSKEQRINNKLVKAKVRRGKITPKHLAVMWANDKFDLALKVKDNDIADAIALSWFGHLRQSAQSTKKLPAVESALITK
jgi:Holliday junction resolvasome RuvABC endonuclease subunit